MEFNYELPLPSTGCEPYLYWDRDEGTKNVLPTEIPLLRPYERFIHVAAIDIVAEYLGFPDRMPFLFIVGRFNAQFVPNDEELLEARNYLHQPAFLRAPIVNLFLNGGCSSGHDMYHTLTLWVFMYNFMCHITNKEVVVFGSWALKMFQVRNFVFDEWMPNDIDVATTTNKEIIADLCRLPGLRSSESKLTIQMVNRLYIDNLNIETSTVITVEIPDFATCTIDISTYTSISEVYRNLLTETDMSASQILINEHSILATHPEMTLRKMFNYTFICRLISCRQIRNVYVRLMKYIDRGFMLNSVGTRYITVDLAHQLRKHSFYSLAEYIEKISPGTLNRQIFLVAK